MKSSNKIKRQSASAITTIIILAIFVFINLLSAYIFTRADLTKEKRYTISPATKNIVGNLNDLLTIKLYASTVLPPDFQNTAQYVNDILNEYQAYSKNIQIKKIDPADNVDLIKQAEADGVPQIEMQVMEKDAFKVQKGFFGLALTYGDKKESIPVLNQTDNLEYDLTSKIRMLTAENLKTVAFLTGQGEHGSTPNLPAGVNLPTGTQDDYNQLKQELQKLYTVKSMSLTDDKSLDGIATLIIAGPSQQFKDEDLLKLDQYILKGGRVIFLIDNTNVGLDMQAKTNHTGIEKLIENYGIKLDDNLVIDASNNVVAFNSGTTQFLVNYPFWPKLTEADFVDSPILNKVGSISFPWVGSLETVAKDNITTTILAKTGPDSVAVNAPYNLDPQQQFNLKPTGNLGLIAMSSGKFTTYFPTKENILKESTGESKIIVVPESDFVSDNYLSRFPSNLNFILNAVDYLTLDDSLSTIRAKQMLDRPIKTLDDNTKTWIKVINIGLIPVLVIVIGVIKFVIRKRNR